MNIIADFKVLQELFLMEVRVIHDNVVAITWLPSRCWSENSFTIVLKIENTIINIVSVVNGGILAYDLRSPNFWWNFDYK